MLARLTETMLAPLYEAITGKPYTTVRSMAAEFGPPPDAHHRDQHGTPAGNRKATGR